MDWRGFDNSPPPMAQFHLATRGYGRLPIYTCSYRFPGCFLLSLSLQVISGSKFKSRCVSAFSEERFIASSDILFGVFDFLLFCSLPSQGNFVFMVLFTKSYICLSPGLGPARGDMPRPAADAALSAQPGDQQGTASARRSRELVQGNKQQLNTSSWKHHLYPYAI